MSHGGPVCNPRCGSPVRSPAATAPRSDGLPWRGGGWINSGLPHDATESVMIPADIEAARHSVLLNAMPPHVRSRLLASAQIADHETGRMIFLQGEPADRVFVVLEGWIKLYRVAANGAEAVVSIMTRGRSFGEAMALRGQVYPVSAEAITPVRLLTLDAAALRGILQTDPDAAIAILSAVFVHLQHLVEQVEGLKARSGVQRVAQFLLDLAPSAEGRCTVALPYNKALIAGRLGMKPESLSRVFARLRSSGVHIEAARVHIDDLGALRSLVAEAP